MSSHDKSVEASRLASKAGDVRVLGGGKTSRGGEVWHVASSGQIVSLTTTSSSVAAMDATVKQYSGALKRLAKK
jgi:hypothetical protein